MALSSRVFHTPVLEFGRAPASIPCLFLQSSRFKPRGACPRNQLPVGACGCGQDAGVICSYTWELLMRMGVMMLMVATVTAIARPAGTRGYQHLQEQCVDRCSICFSSAIQRSVDRRSVSRGAFGNNIVYCQKSSSALHVVAGITNAKLQA